MTKRLFLGACGAALMLATSLFAADATPKTVIHVIDVYKRQLTSRTRLCLVCRSTPPPRHPRTRPATVPS